MRIHSPGLQLSIVAILLAASCYPPDSNNDSKDKSLDNFVDQRVSTLNFCTPNQGSTKAAEDIHLTAPSKSAENAVRISLGAVPWQFLKAFQAVGGQVVAIHDTKIFCGNDAVKTDENYKDGTIPSCWRLSESKKPMIVVSDDPALIRHSMIRAFTYFFTEFFLTRAELPEAGLVSSDPRWQTAINELKDTRESISLAFLEDMQKQNPAQAKTYASNFNSNRLNFSNSVYAEVLDSCYCSDKTRRVMQERFPKTWSASGCRLQ